MQTVIQVHYCPYCSLDSTNRTAPNNKYHIIDAWVNTQVTNYRSLHTGIHNQHFTLKCCKTHRKCERPNLAYEEITKQTHCVLICIQINAVHMYVSTADRYCDVMCNCFCVSTVSQLYSSTQVILSKQTMIAAIRLCLFMQSTYMCILFNKIYMSIRL